MAIANHLERLAAGIPAWNAWRLESPEVKPDLSGANLTRADLSTANLSEANLSGASLPRANLAWADLSRTDLSAADLSHADLSTATLSDTALANADLSHARLAFAKVARCDLRGTVFNHAVFGQTSLETLDLRRAKGLDTAVHLAPSPISLDTFYRSQGRISQRFLRGCGVDESFIENLPTLVAPSTIEFYSCFISYSHPDKNFARHLFDALQSRAIRCWLDEKDLKPGDRILDVVDGAIRLHDKLLICCSEASLQSWWINDEIRKAQERERKENRLIIIPLNLDGYLFEGWRSALASKMRDRVAADFTGWRRDQAKFQQAFAELVRVLELPEPDTRQPPPEQVRKGVAAGFRKPAGGERFHVISSEGRWAVWREGARQALRLYTNQHEAQERAKELAGQADVGEVVVHHSDGSVRILTVAR